IMLVAFYQRQGWVTQGTTLGLCNFPSSQYTRGSQGQPSTTGLIVIQQGTFDDQAIQQQANEHWEPIRQQLVLRHQTISQSASSPTQQTRLQTLQRLGVMHQESARQGTWLVETRWHEDEDSSEEDGSDNAEN
ncbi:hypothetical protein LTR17_027778, partial [Elasticomyces elasticus]